MGIVFDLKNEMLLADFVFKTILFDIPGDEIILNVNFYTS